jgi:hypothetical protein
MKGIPIARTLSETFGCANTEKAMKRQARAQAVGDKTHPTRIGCAKIHHLPGVGFWRRPAGLRDILTHSTQIIPSWSNNRHRKLEQQNDGEPSIIMLNRL